VADRRGVVASGSLFLPSLRSVDLQMQYDRTCPSKTGVFFFAKPTSLFSPKILKIDRLISIVAETEIFFDRSNFPSKSKTENFDGPIVGR
jgi:hypothetical protein